MPCTAKFHYVTAFRALYTSINQWIRWQALSFKNIANKPNGKLHSQYNIDIISVNKDDLKFIITEVKRTAKWLNYPVFHSNATHRSLTTKFLQCL